MFIVTWMCVNINIFCPQVILGSCSFVTMPCLAFERSSEHVRFFFFRDFLWRFNVDNEFLCVPSLSESECSSDSTAHFFPGEHSHQCNITYITQFPKNFWIFITCTYPYTFIAFEVPYISMILASPQTLFPNSCTTNSLKAMSFEILAVWTLHTTQFSLHSPFYKHFDSQLWHHIMVFRVQVLSDVSLLPCPVSNCWLEVWAELGLDA